MGNYYVDENGVGCGMCVSSAPNNFKLEGLVAVVSEQPTSDEEKAMCKEAMENCPVASIHDDGE